MPKCVWAVETRLYQWVGLIVMAQGVQVSSLEQFPQLSPPQPWGKTPTPRAPGLLQGLAFWASLPTCTGPLSVWRCGDCWACSAAQTLCGLRQDDTPPRVSVSFFKTVI